MSGKHMPSIGETYDLRSDGEVERGSPVRMYRVEELWPEEVLCRNRDSGALRTFPYRHFTVTRRLAVSKRGTP